MNRDPELFDPPPHTLHEAMRETVRAYACNELIEQLDANMWLVNFHDEATKECLKNGDYERAAQEMLWGQEYFDKMIEVRYALNCWLRVAKP